MLPFAVAFAGARVLTERPPVDVPIQGIDLPDEAIVLPVAHTASVRVAIPHDPARFSTWSLPTLAPAMAVVRGWETVVHRASRLVLPDAGLGEAVTAARSDLLLSGPVDAGADVVGFLLDVAELGRLGDDADAWMPEIVEPIAWISRSDDPEVELALRACERLAVSAGDDRAAGDLARIRERRIRSGRTPETMAAGQSSFSDLRRGESVGRFVAQVEQRIADEGRLLPLGIPRRWLGSNFEVHGVPTGPRSTVGFAVRWHGERPAVLWEQHGPTQLLTAPAVDADWSSDVGRSAVGRAAPAEAHQHQHRPRRRLTWAGPPPVRSSRRSGRRHGQSRRSCGNEATTWWWGSTRSAAVRGQGHCRSAPPSCRATATSTAFETRSCSPNESERRCSTSLPSGVLPGRSARQPGRV